MLSLLTALSTFLLLALLPSSYCGRMVLSGGMVNTSNAEIYNAFIAQMTPADSPPYIGIITSGVDVEVGESTAKGIMSVLKYLYGVQNMMWLPYHIDNGTTCNSSEWNDQINMMTGIYFNGGNTEPMLNCLFPDGQVTPALELIRSKYADGTLAIYGSSAGSLIQQATPVLRIEDSWSALVNYVLFMPKGGLGNFNHGFLDVHFSTRGRQGTLTRFIFEQQNYSKIGFGIDQDTAIVMDDETGFSVIGTAGVYIFDVTYATNGSKYNSTVGEFAVQNVRVSYLTKGDSYDFETGRITFAPEKVVLQGQNVNATNSTDIFSDGAFTNTSLSLCNSNLSVNVSGVTTETSPQYQVVLTKNVSSLCVIGEIDGVNYTSFAFLSMDIFSPAC